MVKVKAVPERMHTVTPTITVEGCAGAIETWKKAFGAEELSRAADPTGKKIWHAALRIGDSTIFTSDAAPEMGNQAWKTKLWLYLENVDSAFQRAVSAGCTATMQPADMFWGDRMGTVTDRWGNQWTLAQHIKDLTPDEMKKAQDEFVAQMKNQKR
jgi:PhnB protein